jgi:hypothetical protein
MLNKVRLLTIFVTLVLFLTLPYVALGFKTDPYMKSTRTQLRKARAHLFAGDADKGGHRAKAIVYTNAAIDEVDAAMKLKHHHHAQTATADLATSTTSGVTFQGSHMRKALIHLNQAKENLGAAAPDQGGHRAKAMELIDKAIEEVTLANAASN